MPLLSTFVRLHLAPLEGIHTGATVHPVHRVLVQTSKAFQRPGLPTTQCKKKYFRIFVAHPNFSSFRECPLVS